jgi:hypothetical protein
MKTHIRIKTFENNYVHFDTHQNNYTLCGLETGGDETFSIEKSILTKRKVNCPDCIRIVEFCHQIEKKEFKIILF